MKTIRTTQGRRTLALAGTIAVVATCLAACSSSSDSGSGSTSSAAATSGSTSASTTGSDAGSSALAQQVAKLEKPLAAYPVPTTKVSNVSSLKGKLLYYIPITQQSPQFAVTETALKQAAAAVGMKVQVCDGKGTPTAVSSCVNQATKAKAGTIITDAIPYVLAANSFGAAQKAGIPVIISNQVADSSNPDSKTLLTIAAGGSQMQVALSDWISLDSGGKADVLINESTDGPSPAAFVAAGQAAFTKSCPGCKTVINKVSSANQSLIPSSTSSALLKNPTVTYVQAQFEQYLQATQQGVQQANKTSSVKTVAGASQLSGMKQLATKGNLYAAAAQASAYQGWVDVDASMRLMLGTKVPDYTIPVRLFTQESIGDVTLTDAAQQSGEWFGPTTFTDDFKKLWGLG